MGEKKAEKKANTTSGTISPEAQALLDKIKGKKTKGRLLKKLKMAKTKKRKAILLKIMKRIIKRQAKKAKKKKKASSQKNSKKQKDAVPSKVVFNENPINIINDGKASTADSKSKGKKKKEYRSKKVKSNISPTAQLLLNKLKGENKEKFLKKLRNAKDNKEQSEIIKEMRDIIGTNTKKEKGKKTWAEIARKAGQDARNKAKKKAQNKPKKKAADKKDSKKQKDAVPSKVVFNENPINIINDGKASTPDSKSK